MSIEDNVESKLQALDEESIKVMEEVQVYQRQLFIPIWEKRRETVKKIPNFWGTAIGNCPMFCENASENDAEALDNLIDFHVEFDKSDPEYRKVIATFKKNDVFKNETLTKEITLNTEGEGVVVSKSTIEYLKEKTNKRKADTLEDDEDDLLTQSFLEWFANDDVLSASVLCDDIFPNAVDYFTGHDEDDIDDDEEIDLDSEEDEDEDEEEKPKTKKSKK
ncbi:hypothetical protein BY458DRAFT_512795 [Sporodiniella umbellata]|nr:hypothetical protein BY458DRAFT_512795 [Sporodiniella umbellata]